jgi:hypothetical protein
MGAAPGFRGPAPHRLLKGVTMSHDQYLIDVATGIQRWRDFTAHLTGFAAGAAALIALRVRGMRGDGLLITALTAWATALSFQHFSQVMRGPVTLHTVQAAAARQQHQ